jgi:nicotinamidase-related amidase
MHVGGTMKLTDSSPEFIHWLEEWQAALPVLPLSQALPHPKKSALVAVDLTNGFCAEGALASPRVAALVEPTTHLMQAAWDCGVHHILLPFDEHDPQAVEFGDYPPHCIRGTPETEQAPAIRALPFYNKMILFPKNSIAIGLDLAFTGWIGAHPEVDTWIITGDCTDLCTYQLAMFLRLQSNQDQVGRRVLLPADCVNTYDIPLETAQKIGAFPHPGDLIHALFLYHMALNGVKVVQSIR